MIFIYDRKVVDLGIFNYFFDKNFSLNMEPLETSCNIGFSSNGYGSPAMAHIAYSIMAADGEIRSCKMERSFLLTDKAKRSISLEQISKDVLNVVIEDTSKGIKSVKNLLDEIFTT